MYFRVARAHSGFNWELAKQATLAVPFNSIPSGVTAVLQNRKTSAIMESARLGMAAWGNLYNYTHQP